MKRIIYAALACLTFASCEDFLDKQPIEKIGTDEYFKEGCTVIPICTMGFQNCDLFFDRVFTDEIEHP